MSGKIEVRETGNGTRRKLPGVEPNGSKFFPFEPGMTDDLDEDRDLSIYAGALRWGLSEKPQSLSQVKPNAAFAFGAGVFPSHHKLCSIVMEAISLGSLVEFQRSAILTGLLQAESNTGTVLHETLSGGESRNGALLAAVRPALSESDFLLLKAIEKTLAPSRRLRRDFVHGIWGASAAVPNALLLTDPKCLPPSGMGPFAGPIVPSNLDRSLILVWKERDLIEAKAAIQSALSILGTLSEGLARTYPAGLKISGLVRQRLLDRPAIAEAFLEANKQVAAPIPWKLRASKPSAGLQTQGLRH